MSTVDLRLFLAGHAELADLAALPFEPVIEELTGDTYDGPHTPFDPNAPWLLLWQVAALIDLSLDVTQQYLEQGLIPGEWRDGRWMVSRRRFRAWWESCAIDPEGDEDD
jgi:hypothetical protein